MVAMNEDIFRFDSKTLAEVKQVYESAVQRGDKEFVWRGRTIGTDYAKYMIEYLEDKLQ